MPPPPIEPDDEPVERPSPPGDARDRPPPHGGTPPRASPELGVELARLRAELAAELSHLAGVFRAELARLRAEMGADTEQALAGLLATMGHRLQRTRRLLLAAHIVAVVLIVVAVRSG